MVKNAQNCLTTTRFQYEKSCRRCTERTWVKSPEISPRAFSTAGCGESSMPASRTSFIRSKAPAWGSSITSLTSSNHSTFKNPKMLRCSKNNNFEMSKKYCWKMILFFTSLTNWLGTQCLVKTLKKKPSNYENFSAFINFSANLNNEKFVQLFSFCLRWWLVKQLT